MRSLKIVALLTTLFIILLSACTSQKSISKVEILDNLNQTEQVNEILELSSTCKMQHDSTLILFSLKAKRKQLIQEYIPNSELIRLIIINSEGEIIYSSGGKQAYLMMVEKVRPENVGEEYTYNIFWNMRDNRGIKVPMGRYIANLIIPAKPTPYVDLLHFELK